MASSGDFILNFLTCAVLCVDVIHVWMLGACVDVCVVYVDVWLCTSCVYSCFGMQEGI